MTEGGESPSQFYAKSRRKLRKNFPMLATRTRPAPLFVKKKIVTIFYFFSCALSHLSLDCFPMSDHTFPATPEEYEEYCETLAAAEPLPDPPEEIWLDDSHLDGNWEDYSHEDREDQYLDAMYEDRYDVSEYGMDGCCGDF
jgi:hypothetical protein